jgi:hypothetical protein
MTDANENVGPVDETAESNQTFWLVCASPTIWAAHFLISYMTVAVWCAKFAAPDQNLGPARVAVGFYTVVALLAIFAVGVITYRRHSHGDAELPHDFDSPQDRHRFLGFAGLLLTILSAVATLFVASAAVFIGDCY